MHEVIKFMSQAGFYEDLRNMPGQVKSTICLTIIISILCLIFYFKVKKVDPLAKTPKWLVPFILLVSTINDFVKTYIGKRWKSYAPYFVSLGIFLFISNTSSIWGITPPTTYIMINAALAVISFFIIQITGIVSNGVLGYLKSFVTPIPVLLPINLIGEFSFPLSLCLRITGNMMAGSVISALVIGAFGYAAIPFMPVINAIMDLFSGVIQAAVFVMLSIIFVSMKIDDSEKIEV